MGFGGSRSRLQAIGAALLAVLYAVVSVGVLPSSAMVVRWFGRVTFERFPCENCACGCASAHECWTACCCHTTPQRLAWAIREGVMPPDSAQFTDAEWIAAANSVRPGSARCALCVAAIKHQLAEGVGVEAGEPKASCCSGGSSEAACCDASGSCCDGLRVCGNDTAPAGALPCVSALSCKRQMPMQTLAPQPSTPRERIVLIEPDVERFGGFAVPVSSVASSRALDHDVPPPRW